MDFFQLFTQYTAFTLLLLACMAFTAGFIDAVVGGGGLIQLPAMLISLPDTPLATIFGTNKIAALSGTSVSAYQYSRRISYHYPVLLTIGAAAFLASFLGARAVSVINVSTLKPIILVILILIAIYTFVKKDIGATHKPLPVKQQRLYGALIGLAVGFYDGFFGPGTGSFLVLGFVVILGFEFVTASAYAKVVNCLTNISALIVFIRQGNYLLELAVLLALCNIIGSVIGSRTALRRGNRFIRIIFLVIVALMILRYGYDVFLKD